MRLKVKWTWKYICSVNKNTGLIKLKWKSKIQKMIVCYVQLLCSYVTYRFCQMLWICRFSFIKPGDS